MKSKVTASIYAIFVLVILIIVNGPNIHRPPYDHHTFRQCQTLSTIDIYYREGIDLLHPKANYYGAPGVLVLEFPIFQAFCTVLYHLFGENLTVIRTLNILITLTTGALVYLIARKWFDIQIAAASTLFFLTAPLNLIYMSSILIDPFGVLLALLVLYAAMKSGDGVGGVWRWRILFLLLGCMLAVIKALYLFPAIIFFAFQILNRRTTLRAGLADYALFIPAGLCFLAWNFHAYQANNASYFTAGLAPTTPLGFSKLLTLEYYIVIGKRLLWECIGPVGGPLAAVGWLWAAVRLLSGRATGVDKTLFLTGVICLGYWLAFANINFPHNYYSLILVPFASMAAAATLFRSLERISSVYPIPVRLTTASVVCVLAVAVTSWAGFSLFRGFPLLQEFLVLQRHVRPAIREYEYAMLFLRHRGSPLTRPAHDETASGLYATKLRGTGKVVIDEKEAVQIWNRYSPHYNDRLRYAVFFGIRPPAEITRHFKKTTLAKEDLHLYVFEK